QTITFTGLPGKTFGTVPFTVNATSSSGLTVTFSSTTKSVCTVLNNTVTLVGVGTCTIVAPQAGNSNYSAAATVTQSFAVAMGSHTITFTPLPNRSLGASFSVSATASSGLPVTFSSMTTANCSVSSTVTSLAPGTRTISANQAGNGNYNPASSLTQS